MAFSYQALQGDEIRLLKPVSSKPGKLAFRIRHVSLASKPKFAALSYVWGKFSDGFSISLDGQDFSVFPNLYAALQQIMKMKLTDHFLWVDAICIDQGASDERSVQVRRMRDIYEQAERVIVWLGQPNNHDQNRLGFHLMHRLYRRFEHDRPYRPWWWPKKPQMSRDVAAAFFHKVRPDKDRSVFDKPGTQTHEAWIGITAIFKSGWWTRTWVLQEGTVPERALFFYIPHTMRLTLRRAKVHFWFGDQKAYWHELVIAIGVIDRIVRTPGIDATILARRPYAPAARLLLFRSQRITWHSSDFLELLQWARVTDCTNLQDKVYAPLCLASNDVRRSIVPDYAGKTTLEVYTDVVRYFLSQQQPDLSFLGYIVYREESRVLEGADMPSWVPNWQDKLPIFVIPKVLYGAEVIKGRAFDPSNRRNVPNYRGPASPAYCPLTGMSPRPHIDGGALHLQGALLDEVGELCPTAPAKVEDMESFLASIRETVSRWKLEFGDKYFTGETFAEAINHTVVFDVIYDRHGKPKTRGGAYDRVLLKKELPDLNAGEELQQSFVREAVLRAELQRRIGRSRKHYLFLGPYTAAVGDLICALAGGRVLYILRPLNRGAGQYRFIGECYAHGLMDGEIDRRLEKGEMRMEDLSLI